MEITGFIRVRSVLVVPGNKINGICLRHEDSSRWSHYHYIRCSGNTVYQFEI